MIACEGVLDYVSYGCYFFSTQAQFFPSSKFCLYNMFNHFFFESVASEKVFQDFLRREGLVLVMDPPFGGLAEVLSHSVRIIWDDWRKVNSDGNVFKNNYLHSI